MSGWFSWTPVTTILAVVGMLSIVANSLLFSADNWEKNKHSVAREQHDPQRDRELRGRPVVFARGRSRIDPIRPAPPGFGRSPDRQLARFNAVVQGAELAFERPRVQSLWAKANRAAAESWIGLVNGRNGPVHTNQGVVTLDMGSIVGGIASQLGLPASLSKKLPPNVAQLTVLKSDQLRPVQNGGNLIRHLALWLTILVPILYGLAIVLAAGDRRRTLMTVGIAIVFAGLLGVAARSILQTQVTNSLVHEASLRPAVADLLAIMTEILGTIACAFFSWDRWWAAAWFAGPARVVTAVRRGVAPFLRDHHLRAPTLTAGVMVLIFIWDPIPATGKPAGIIVFMVLALLGTEMLRRQTMVEFPVARRGELLASFRRNVAGLRGRRHHDGTSPPTGTTVVDHLERLAALHRDGSLSAEDYEAANASLLRG